MVLFSLRGLSVSILVIVQPFFHLESKVALGILHNLAQSVSVALMPLYVIYTFILVFLLGIAGGGMGEYFLNKKNSNNTLKDEKINNLEKTIKSIKDDQHRIQKEKDDLSNKLKKW